MSPEYEPRTDWSNVGLSVRLLNPVYPNVCIKTPWANVIFKRWSDRLFSERYGYMPTLKVFAVCITLVRLKRARSQTP